MRLIGWAIALAAAGLTPAAAPDAAQPTAPAAPRQRRRTPPAGTAQDATKPDAAQPAIVYGSVGHAIPTPGIGEPDGRKGIQEQVTPIGQRSRRLPQRLLLPLCAVISVFVLGPAALRDGPLPPRRQSGAVAQLAQHADRGDLDAGPGADPGRDRDAVDPAAAPPIHAAAGRPHGQGHRPPMVLDATNIPTTA